MQVRNKWNQKWSLEKEVSKSHLVLIGITNGSSKHLANIYKINKNIGAPNALSSLKSANKVKLIKMFGAPIILSSLKLGHQIFYRA